jgi:hypothetical protein
MATASAAVVGPIDEPVTRQSVPHLSRHGPDAVTGAARRGFIAQRPATEGSAVDRRVMRGARHRDP